MNGKCALLHYHLDLTKVVKLLDLDYYKYVSTIEDLVDIPLLKPLGGFFWYFVWGIDIKSKHALYTSIFIQLMFLDSWDLDCFKHVLKKEELVGTTSLKLLDGYFW